MVILTKSMEFPRRPWILPGKPWISRENHGFSEKTTDLLEETIACTNFGSLQAGKRVNLERSLAANGRLGGHFLSGHVDETGEVTVFEKRGDNYFLEVKASSSSAKYLAPKGSVAINGVSLTVYEVDGGVFSVWLIPHTLDTTNLGQLEAGNLVNLEFDLLAKYVESILAMERKQ